MVTYSCYEWCMPLVNGCVELRLIVNAVLNVYLCKTEGHD